MTEYNKYIDISRSYLYCQLKLDRDYYKGLDKKELRLPFVTISRESGAGGTRIGKALADFMNMRNEKRSCPWSLFDKNLADEIFHEYSFSGLENILPEKKFSDIQSLFEELFGVHPTKSEMVRRIGDTIKKFAKMGHVVIIGRGGAFLTRNFPGGTHIRLIGSFERRTAVIMNKLGMNRKHAEEFIREEDRHRFTYVKKLYGIDVSDPHYYDIVINTDHFPDDEIVRMIGEKIFRTGI